MSVAAYDLGIHFTDVAEDLHRLGAVTIVGYQRSGKSTLAEILAREARRRYPEIIHQNATAWLSGERQRIGDPAAHSSSIDGELTAALARLEREHGSCWVVDDAEVLLAYATDEFLQIIGRKILAGRFSVILIRNRFVREDMGWFSNREGLLHDRLPTFHLHPLVEEAALAAARAMFSGPAAEAQATWLVAISGGIPGLMNELAPYAPDDPLAPPSAGLRAHALRRRRDLGLDRPLRAALVAALGQGILPPRSMLSSAADTDLAALEIAGMVRPDYLDARDPFRGGFWRLVAPASENVGVPDDVVDAAVELEIVIGELGLRASFATALGLDDDAHADLADAFMRSLVCERSRPELVRPLGAIVAENLGRGPIAAALRRRTGDADTSGSGAELAARLLRSVGLP
jgi:hypothetical protein